MPCKDHFTEADIPDLSGYVAIVTGGMTNYWEVLISSLVN
jgi:hypothetical protein